MRFRHLGLAPNLRWLCCYRAAWWRRARRRTCWPVAGGTRSCGHNRRLGVATKRSVFQLHGIPLLQGRIVEEGLPQELLVRRGRGLKL